MNTEYFFCFCCCFVSFSVRADLAVHPINQNLFSINFFCCSFSFSWLTEFVYFSMWKKHFSVCALFWVGRQWFFDLLLQFRSLSGGVWGESSKRETIERQKVFQWHWSDFLFLHSRYSGRMTTLVVRHF